MNDSVKLLPFALDGQKYALPLSSVEKAYRAVEITRLPQAPSIVLGIINVRGNIIPVVDIRKRFRLPERRVGPDDQLIVARTPKLRLALVADRVDPVIETDELEIVSTDQVLPDIDYLDGVVKLEDGLLLIHDLRRFLSLEEEGALMNALRKSGQPR